MNIKIKATGVTCLVGDDYDRVYTALKNQLSEGNEQLFTERIPGHEYLQWELPGDGWVSLSEGDPLMAQEVRQELLQRKMLISKRFGGNQEMAQKILSVPDDGYVYYKAGTDGQLQIRLTAWGYRYPERVGGGDATGTHAPHGKTEHVCIRVMYNNNPVPNEVLYLNGFRRSTDPSGVYDIGELPIGYQFEVKVGNQQQKVVVQAGQGDIRLDVTVHTTVEVDVTLDGKPYVGATASLSYMGHDMQLTTGENGKATAQVPLDPNNGVCSVSLGNDFQQQSLQQPITVFSFNIESPKEEVVEEPKEETVEEPKEEIVEEPKEEIVEEPKGEVVEEPKEEVVEEPKEEVVEEPEEEVVEEPEEEVVEEPKEEVIEKAPHNFSWLWSILVALLLLLMVVLTYILCFNILAV